MDPHVQGAGVTRDVYCDALIDVFEDSAKLDAVRLPDGCTFREPPGSRRMRPGQARHPPRAVPDDRIVFGVVHQREIDRVPVPDVRPIPVLTVRRRGARRSVCSSYPITAAPGGRTGAADPGSL